MWPKTSNLYEDKPTYFRGDNLCYTKSDSVWQIVHAPCLAGKIKNNDGKCSCPHCLTKYKCDQHGSYLHTYKWHDRFGLYQGSDWPQAADKHNGQPTYTRAENLCLEDNDPVWPMVLHVVSTQAPTHAPTMAPTMAPSPAPTPAKSSDDKLSTPVFVLIIVAVVGFIALILGMAYKNNWFKLQNRRQSKKIKRSTRRAQFDETSTASNLKSDLECRQRLRDSVEILF